MKFHFKLILGSICLVSILISACVKNLSFKEAYTIPEVYNYESKDSSAKARVIMMHGLQHYLNLGASQKLSQAIIDSLWSNRGNPFTAMMVPDFLYRDTVLNKMKSVNLQSVTGDADSIKSFANKVVAASQYNGRTAANGTAGVLSQTVPFSTKRLFDSLGVENAEVWKGAMLGAMALRSMLGNLVASGQSAGQAWDLAYDYMGFPKNYDPAYNYSTLPLKVDRPLSLAALNNATGNSSVNFKMYEAFRRAKTSAVANDERISAASIDSIVLYAERAFAFTAIASLDSVKQFTDIAAKLHYLSQAYGLVWALKYRDQNITPLSFTNYWIARNVLAANFYTLVQDPALVQLNLLRKTLADAYKF